jgi:hypothetical protein
MLFVNLKLRRPRQECALKLSGSGKSDSNKASPTKKNAKANLEHLLLACCPPRLRPLRLCQASHFWVAAHRIADKVDEQFACKNSLFALKISEALNFRASKECTA